MQKILSIPGVVVLLVGIGLLLSGFFSAPAHEVTITVNETSVYMSNKFLAANEPVEFIITNTGKIPVLAVFEKEDNAGDQAVKDYGQNLTTEVKVLPGETHTLILTITNPGSYQFTGDAGDQAEYDLVQSFSVGMGSDNVLHGWTGGWLLASLSALLLAGTGLSAYSMTAHKPILSIPSN